MIHIISNTQFTFIDLFAGIGGFRLAFQKAGLKCVFSSEWDKLAQKTYEANYGEIPSGDITQIDAKDIPNHDILLAGFPCQPFSIAGVSKHNSLGTSHGFNHETQGSLFFDIARIIKAKQPSAFVLENVKHLQRHDNGRTFRIILDTLQNQLGYYIYYKIIDAKFVVPQHRERIYIIGFREPRLFQFPTLENRNLSIKNILEPNVDEKYTLSNHRWQYLQNYAQKHKLLGNGFGYGLVDLNGISRTLSARYYKDGSEILIPQLGKNPRRLTPRECARLMGFGDDFKIVTSDTTAYKQFGNSVVVPVIEEIAKEVIKALLKQPVSEDTLSLHTTQLKLPI